MNPFMQRLADSRQSGSAPLLGTFVMSTSEIICEAIAHCGFDWIVIDGEHSPLDMMTLVHLLQATGGAQVQPVVRVAWNDAVLIKRVLDAGAQTLLVPFVETAEEAARAVAATRYPPEGVRGMAGLTRASRFGAVADHFKTANTRQSVIAQIETPRAMERLEDIAGVPGVDALFLGPTDLSGAMGFHGNAQQPEVQRVLAQAVERCHKLGKPVGTVTGTPQSVMAAADAGFDFVGLGSDLGFVVGAARGGLAEIRGRQRRVDPTSAHQP